MLCLDDRSVHAWVRGTLDTDGELVRSHLDECEACRDLVASIVDTQWIGERVTRYRIVEKVGGGAMGEVFRAHDPDLGRDVAIKLVRSGGSEQRLLREARAMAQLAHPNVIRVYDVGTVADKVFLAMELVAGSTLSAWFGEHHGWRAVLGAMRQAGSGLSAAHGAGLVHGDFKPDNVLVAGDGRVLVTDFGLSRSGTPDPHAPTARTTSNAGTPAYMAAEQFDEEAVATPASDQFAFCVTLYEGLYGRRPFAGADLPTLYTNVAGGDVTFPARPRVPARVQRALRRGLSPDPAKRFPSMRELCAELDRASSRKRLAIVAGALGVGAAVATTALVMSARGPHCNLGASQLEGVWGAATRDRVHAAFERSKLPYAATSFATVVSTLDRYAAAWAATFDDTCAATHVRETQSEAMLDLRMECLRRRKQELGAIVDALATGDAEVVRGSVDAALALPAVEACANVASLQDLEPRPADATSVRAVEAELARCNALLATGRYRPANACATAVAKAAADAGYGPTIAQAELLAGMTTSRLREWEPADASLERAVLAAETSRDSRTRAQALVGLVAVSGERADFAQGHKRADLARAVIKGLGDDQGLAADLAFREGTLLFRESKLDAASDLLVRAARLREQAYGATDSRVAEPLAALAAVQITRKQLADAGRTLDRALAIQTGALGDMHPSVGKTLHLLAQLQMRMGKYDAALATQKREYDILVAAYGETHRDVALAIDLAAQANIFAGKYAEAEPFARRSSELMEKIAPDSLDLALSLQTYASVLSRIGKLDEALAIHERILAIREKALGPEHLLTTQAKVNLAMALRAHKRCAEALPLLNAALVAREKQLPANHPDILRVLQTMGDCDVDLGDPKSAVPVFERVVAGVDGAPRRTADDHVTHAMAMYGLARASWDANVTRDRAAKLAHDAKAELDELKDKRAADIASWARDRHVKL